jgi:uncharacterized protein (UPF0332 family)
MNARDFLDLAMRLSNEDSEADLRTSVSRAYYGAFHTAVQLLAELGVSLPAGPESHQKVRFCLMESGEPLGVAAGTQLHELRTARNRADYDLVDTRYGVKMNALSEIHSAQVVLRSLDLCRREPIRSRFRAKVRDYAANVLRLPVRE